MSKPVILEEYSKDSVVKQTFVEWWQSLKTENQNDIEILFDHRQNDVVFNYCQDASGVPGWHELPIIHGDLNRIAETNTLELPYTVVYEKHRDAYDEEWTYESFGFADYPHELKISRYSYQPGIFHAPHVIAKWTEMCRELFRKYVLDLY